MTEQAIAGSAVATVGLAGLIGSNVLLDLGLDRAIARAFASAVGGAAFLIAVMTMDPWVAVAVALAMAGLLLSLRLRHRQGLRGSEGSRSGQAWSQVTYAAAGIASLAIGWGILGDRWLAFLPIAFVAWGDAAAGLARETVWKGRVLSWWPSVVMLAICLISAALFQPYWVGATGALVATVAERRRPKLGVLWDDNVNIVVASGATLVLLAMV